VRPEIDPKVDYAFKKLFGSESNTDLLSDVLHAVLQPPADRRFVELAILNPFNEKDTTEDKLSVLDIKARDASGHRPASRTLLAWSTTHTKHANVVTGAKSIVAIRCCIARRGFATPTIGLG
jgi:hypothetical protein